MNVIEIPDGSKGFDANSPVSVDSARRLVAADYRFALRYVRRDPRASNDLNQSELATLLSAGLAVGIVQHFGPHEGWTPSDDLGKRYGMNAVDACRELGIPDGATVWLDLESVDAAVDIETIIRYCNRWHDVVAMGGLLPGIYVGYGARLTPDQLYRRLKFTRYFGAYNLNSDQVPAVRGLCMKQHEAKPGDRPDGVRFPIDVDVAIADTLGGRATMVVA